MPQASELAVPAVTDEWLGWAARLVGARRMLNAAVGYLTARGHPDLAADLGRALAPEWAAGSDPDAVDLGATPGPADVATEVVAVRPVGVSG
jgi:hypothetical protein